MLNVVAILLVLTAGFAYLNHRFLKWPTTIGVMAIAMVLSLAIAGLERFGYSTLRNEEHALLSSIDFTEVLMQGMLSLLLFAGALHIDVAALRAYKWQVGVLALVGTAVSTLLIGFGTWYMLGWIGLQLGLPYCLLFGALISPTDPIAVLGILKTARVPKNLETMIAGESLLNDGVAVVLFALLLTVVTQGRVPTVAGGLMLFVEEAGGGVFLGLVVGYAVYRMLRSIDHYQTEVLITLAAVLGGYALASSIHVSGPLAMVVVGLCIGNAGREFAMSERTRARIDTFWELVDEILNGLLFVLIGLEVTLFEFPAHTLIAAALIIVVTLAARYLVVGFPVTLFHDAFRLPPGSGKVLTWGGVRGGISVALALSIPPNPQRDLIVVVTYCVVVFSILVQGLTIGRLARSVTRAEPARARSSRSAAANKHG